MADDGAIKLGMRPGGTRGGRLEDIDGVGCDVVEDAYEAEADGPDMDGCFSRGPERGSGVWAGEECELGGLI